MKKTCCIVTIIKYEHSYLKEFIDYHSMIGVSKFIIYNNGTQIKENYPNCVIIDFPGDVIKRTAYSHFTINILKLNCHVIFFKFFLIIHIMLYRNCLVFEVESKVSV